MRNYLITGGTDGIGRAAALLLADQDSRIILIGRNRQRGEAAEREVRAAGGSARFLSADLSTVHEMRAAAAQVGRELDHLDAVVHAAGGVFSNRRQLTEEGLEQTFAIQTLARLVVTEELAGLLRESSAPKVVAIAGGGAYGKKGLDLSDHQGERTHSYFGSIGKSAAANDLLTMEQMARHEGIAFFNYGPGLVRTKVPMPNPIMRVLLETFGRPFSRSPEQAAADVAGLLSGDHPAGFYGPGLKPNDPPDLRDDPALSSRFWDYCSEAASRITSEPVIS